MFCNHNLCIFSVVKPTMNKEAGDKTMDEEMKDIDTQTFYNTSSNKTKHDEKPENEINSCSNEQDEGTHSAAVAGLNRSVVPGRADDNTGEKWQKVSNKKQRRLQGGPHAGVHGSHMSRDNRGQQSKDTKINYSNISNNATKQNEIREHAEYCSTTLTPHESHSGSQTLEGHSCGEHSDKLNYPSQTDNTRQNDDREEGAASCRQQDHFHDKHQNHSHKPDRNYEHGRNKQRHSTKVAHAATKRHHRSHESESPDFVFFWQNPSVFSQWLRCTFYVDGRMYNCAEQFMMHRKAGWCLDFRAYFFKRSDSYPNYKSVSLWEYIYSRTEV